MPKQLPDKSDWVQADFNGVWGYDLRCLSHENTAKTCDGRRITLFAGQQITVYDRDADENNQPDDIFASGIVEPSPWNMRCRGSVWCLRIDSDGIRHESDLKV